MFFKSLIVRVILLNILLMAVGIGIYTLIHVHREQDHLIESNRDTAELLLSTIEKSIYTAMQNGNSVEVQQILEVVGKGHRLLGLRIFSPEGTILRSADPAEVGHRISPAELSVFTADRSNAITRVDGGQEALTIIRPIVSDERCYLCHGVGRRVLGVLSMNLDLAETNRRLSDSTNVSFLSMMILVASFSIGISFILLRFVRQPMAEMAEKMARIESGDMSVRLDPRNHDEVGRVMRSFNSMVDNLEKAKAELEQCHYRQMERADRLASVGEMATGIAHEIKNPLACISGAVTVLADDFPDGDPRREVIEKVLDQIHRLDKTATDLLSFGRPGRPEFTYVSVNDLLDKTCFFVAQHPEARKIDKVKNLAADLPPVWVDAKQIQQVFFNVIINAIQSMPDGGTLRLSSDLVERDERSYVRVQVGDTGRGITPEDLDKIFVPFFTTKTQGTGLGLAICRQLLEQHGGCMDVVSTVGVGTTFSILLPAGTLPDGVTGEDA